MLSPEIARRLVATAVADGKPNAQLAAALTLTIPTVKSYLSPILSKTATSSRMQHAVAPVQTASHHPGDAKRCGFR